MSHTSEHKLIAQNLKMALSPPLALDLKKAEFINGRVLIGPEKPAQIQPDLAIDVLSPGTTRNQRGVKFIDFAAHARSMPDFRTFTPRCLSLVRTSTFSE